MLLETLSTALRKVRQINSTDASFPSRVPRLAWSNEVDNQPSGKGDSAAQATASAVIDLTAKSSFPDRGPSNGLAQNKVKIIPFGTGSDTNTFKMRLIGWEIAYERDSGEDIRTAIWIPTTLAEFTCTLSTPPGLAGTVVDGNQLFADTIALDGTSGNDDIDISITPPADNTIAHVVVDLKAAQKLEIIFDRNSSASSCNALYKLY
jgi:hypothetical protein